MLWKDRILSAVMAVVVAAAATAAVVRFSPEKPRFTPGQIEEGITYEVTGVPSDEIVAVVDGNGAEAELFTFWLRDTCSNFQQYWYVDVASNWDAEVGGTTLKEIVREDVLSALKQQLVVENLAARYGVTLSGEVENALAEMREQNVEMFGEDGYLAEIYKLGLSEAGYDRVMRMFALNRALYDAYSTPGSALYASEDTLHAYAAGRGYITADHILLAANDPYTGAPLDDEALAEKWALAEKLLAQLRASDDPVALFAELADENSEDPGRLSNPEGYTFTEGSMVKAFESAAYALGENEISDVVESEFGFHIILRRPLDAEAVRDEYFNVVLNGEIEKEDAEFSPALDRFDVVALYDALMEAQGVSNTAGVDGG